MAVAWAFVADAVPLYPLYALFFADTGLTDPQISGLLILWSAVGLVAEVPSGVLADPFSRRSALVASGLLQAAGYVLWVTMPGFPGFAAGFVLWGLGGALSSGALEALLYDALAAAGAEAAYPRVNGWVTAAGHVAQLPVAIAATVLFGAGGYELAAWASVAGCVGAAALASRLPETPRASGSLGDGGPAAYLRMLRSGLREAVGYPAVRLAVVAAALLGGIDGIDEYLPLMARDWGVAPGAVPAAMLALSVAGAAGAALGGVRWTPATLAATLGAAGVGLALAAGAGRPAGLVAVAVFYALHQLVLVTVDARVQDRIEGPARATVTSVAGLGVELAAILLFAAWALGGPALVAALALTLAAALPRLLRDPVRA